MSKKKKLDEFLRKIALQLPRQGYDCRVTVVRTGEQLTRNAGKLLKDEDGSALKMEKRYVQTLTDQRPVNHLRRLRRAYESGGWDAVARYINGVNAAFDEAIQGHANILTSIEDAKAGLLV